MYIDFIKYYIYYLGLTSNGPLCQKLNCLKYGRKMLSSRKSAPIDDFIKAGILPLLVDFLTPKFDDKYNNYIWKIF